MDCSAKNGVHENLRSMIFTTLELWAMTAATASIMTRIFNPYRILRTMMVSIFIQGSFNYEHFLCLNLKNIQSFLNLSFMIHPSRVVTNKFILLIHRLR